MRDEFTRANAQRDLARCQSCLLTKPFDGQYFVWIVRLDVRESGLEFGDFEVGFSQLLRITFGDGLAHCSEVLVHGRAGSKSG